MELGSKIYVAGHRGMVGSAIVRTLNKAGHAEVLGRTSSELDLRDGGATREFFEKEKPDYVIMAAARVGGIHYNSSAPYDFIYENLMMAANVIEAARHAKTKKLLFLGSSCIYPKLAKQPIKEESLLTGPFEVTNEAYALAKIAGIKLCTFARQQYGCDFISAMPCNLYGIGDNFSLENSHVLPAMIRKMNDAKNEGAPSVKLWGTGLPLREFLHVDDLARGCLVLMEKYSEEGTINLGSGEEVTIRDLAEIIASVVGYYGKLEFDTSRPDGTPRKIMDNSRIQTLGWKPKISLKQGIQEVYQWYLWNEASLRK